MWAPWRMNPFACCMPSAPSLTGTMTAVPPSEFIMRTIASSVVVPPIGPVAMATAMLAK